MKKSNYLQTEDDKTVDYNNDANLDDLETIDYNNDTNLDELETIGYNSDADIELTTAPEISTAQQQIAKKIVKKYKNLKRKGQPIIYAKTNKKRKKGDVVFIKKVPIYPRDRLARAIKKREQEEEVKFMKQVSLHPREQLKEITKKLVHPRDKMKNKASQIARDNASALMNEKFVFDSKEILNKTLLFDTSEIDEELVMDKIRQALPPDNDQFYIEYPERSNSFTLKREDGR